MSKEAARRYRTAADLAADERRHLAERPVRARGDAWGYRARKVGLRPPGQHRAQRRRRSPHRARSDCARARASAGAARPGAARRLAFDAALELDPRRLPGRAPRRVRLGRRRRHGACTSSSSAATKRSRSPKASAATTALRAGRADGSRIAFQSEGRIYVVPATGGPARLLVEPEPPADGSPTRPGPRTAGTSRTWRSGTFTSAPSRVAPGATSHTARNGPHSLAWSPDGRWIAFVDGNATFVFGPTAEHDQPRERRAELDLGGAGAGRPGGARHRRPLPEHEPGVAPRAARLALRLEPRGRPRRL
jgi:hypothetical protein